MNRRARSPLPCLAAALLVTACAGGEADRPAVVEAYGTTVNSADYGRALHLFIWPDYLDPALVAEFEAAYGVTVTVDYYDTNEAMIAKLQAGGTGQYDLVVGSDYAIEMLRGANLLQPLDHGALPNLANLEERFRNVPADPGNAYSVAYQWGTTGIGVRWDLIADTTRIVPSWALVFDPAAALGPFTMLTDQRETIVAALLWLGHSPNSVDEAELAAAERLLMAQRDRLLTYAPSSTSRDLLASGDALLGHNYSGDVLQGQSEVPGIRYLIPREGAVIWSDNLAIPTGAPDRRLAELFINFVLDPEVGARLSDFTRYATPNEASLPLVDPALRANPGIYPDSATLARLYFLRDLGAAREAYDRIWTRLRAGADGG